MRRIGAVAAKMKLPRRLLLGLSAATAALSLAGPNAYAAAAQQGATCDEALAQQADSATDGLTDWGRVDQFFRRYGGCDDGSIAEGVSDGVATLLTERWAAVGELARLSRRDPVFEQFVLRHIDELMTPEQGAMIMANAQKRCPAGARRLCRKIQGADAEAIYAGKRDSN
jgi:hypothetical protein